MSDTARSRSRPKPEISTYAAAKRYLDDRVDFERMRVVRLDKAEMKLERMHELLRRLGNPHELVRMVHVAGTVGKGSTVAMISAMLQGCGYAAGQFTSPHLVNVRERIAINGEQIGRSDFTRLVDEAARAAKKAKLDPTYFELMTAVSFKHFEEQAVDIAVVETGLGGRLDCTNVMTPEVTVVTQIGFDHTHILGGTLADIAREKAGIFKRGVPAITVEQSDEVEGVLREVAASVEAPLRVVNKDIEFSYRFGASPDLGPHTRVCLLTETSQFMHLPVPLRGEHQAINCGLALAVIDTLKASGFEFAEVQLHEGLSRTNLPGRMELVWDQPRILIDGAHNELAMGALMRCVGAHVPYDSMVCIFGCCEDKQIGPMLEKVALGADKVIFTRLKDNPRSADPDELQRRFADVSGKMSQTARSLAEALDLATKAVGRDDLICVTGSFYLAGETKRHLQEIQRRRMQHA